MSRCHNYLLSIAAVLMLASLPASAQPLSCVAQSSATPSIRAEGVAELGGDLLITCTGGLPTAAGQLIPQANLQIFAQPGVEITSRLLGDAGFTEAVLLMDEPLPSEQIICGGGTAPVADPAVAACLQNTGIGIAGVSPYLPSSYVPQGFSSTNRPNAWLGQRFITNPNGLSSSSLIWRSIQIDPPGPGRYRVIRIKNLRFNASLLGATFGNPAPIQVAISAAQSNQSGGGFTPPPISVPLSNSSPVVGLVQVTQNLTLVPGTATQCEPGNSKTVTLKFAELLPNAWKTRSLAADPATSPIPTSSDNLGYFYDLETAFYKAAANGAHWPATLAAPFGGVSGARIAGPVAAGAIANPPILGLADFGTRLVLRLSNLPSEVSVAASTSGSTKVGNAAYGTARLIDEESGSYFAPPNGNLGVLSGKAVALWEILITDTASFETFEPTLTFSWAVGSPPPSGAIVNAHGWYAPQSFSPYAAGASPFHPIPRFQDNSSTILQILTVNACPVVLNVASSHVGTFAPSQVGATYTIGVGNSGASPTSGTVTVTDVLPTGLTATAISGSGWSCTLGSLSCNRADALASGANYPPITVTVNVAANAASLVTNVVNVTGGGSLNASGNDPTYIGIVPDLTISKTHVGSFYRGQVGASYLISVTNVGQASTTGTVTVNDTYPIGLTSTQISGSGWSCTQPHGPCIRNSVLGIGASYPPLTLKVTVAPNAPSLLTNYVSVSGGGEINANNSSASDPTNIVAPPLSRIGIYNAGLWRLDKDGNGVYDAGTDGNFFLGFVGATLFTGDWNGDGKTKAGVYSNGYWYLDYDGNGFWDGGATDKLIAWGWAGVTPFVGDWNGDGKTKIGVFSNGFWFLDYNGDFLWDGGAVDKQVALGWVGVTPLVGDWDGDGRTNIGVYNNGFWFLDYDGNYVWDGGVVDKQVGWGWAGVTPIIGDWNGDGKAKIGVYSGGYWYIDYDGNYLWQYPATDKIFSFGWVGTTPVMGDWNGDGKTKPGTFVGGFWYLDYDGSGVFDGAGTDRIFSFGVAGDTPVVGRW